MKKEYKATNHKYTIQVDERAYDFPECISNSPSWYPYKHIMKDLAPWMSSYSNWLVIRQCLENLKAHDELTGCTDHFGQVLKNINDYVETGTSEWCDRDEENTR